MTIPLPDKALKAALYLSTAELDEIKEDLSQHLSVDVDHNHDYDHHHDHDTSLLVDNFVVQCPGNIHVRKSTLVLRSSKSKRCRARKR